MWISDLVETHFGLKDVLIKFMRLIALTHIFYVRASHLDAQLDSLQSKEDDYKGKNNLSTRWKEKHTYLMIENINIWALSVRKKKI